MLVYRTAELFALISLVALLEIFVLIMWFPAVNLEMAGCVLVISTLQFMHPGVQSVLYTL